MFKVCLGMKLAKPGGAYRCFTYYSGNPPRGSWLVALFLGGLGSILLSTLASATLTDSTIDLSPVLQHSIVAYP